MSITLRLQQQTVLITGGAGGIGRAAALLFSQQGATVAIIDRDQQAGEEVTAIIHASGGKAAFFQADVSEVEPLLSAIESAKQWLGHIDNLFNHAGSIIVKPLHDTTLEEYEKLMAINSRSAFLTCKAVLPHMVSRGKGNIVITSSINAEKGFSLESVYCMTKGAVLQLARSISAEYREHGIRCNAICPGFVQTAHGLNELDQLDSQGQTWQENSLAQTQVRICRAEEAAAAALFLLSSDASFVNGTALYVDNGWATKG
ncbi:SDR family NAD(P)-dependent oxidoreductase [Pantoea sp. A4]|uniref:SDR family NAD(P)-dependent oxidoreductase n=1 Tax=Pantoea sp. A4 TaxID=1225184 RepID=UPI00035FA7D2|nr:SDR family oxidoreductase [Pantoea sp. A4]